MIYLAVYLGIGMILNIPPLVRFWHRPDWSLSSLACCYIVWSLLWPIAMLHNILAAGKERKEPLPSELPPQHG